MAVRFRAIPLADGWVVRDFRGEYEDSQVLAKEDALVAAKQENEDEQEVDDLDLEIRRLNVAARNFRWHEHHATNNHAAKFWSTKAAEAKTRLADLIYD